MLLEAALAVGAARIGLWSLRFGTLARLMDACAGRLQCGDRPAADAAIDRVVRAVETAAGRVPRATCLTRALAGRWMLERRGIPTTLEIGVAKSEMSVDGHAWIRARGRVVLGGEGLDRYAVLGGWNGGSSHDPAAGT